MDAIRVIKESDYPVLQLYWNLAGHNVDAKDLYPKDSSYIYERDGSLMYGVALYCINGLPIAYVEAVIRNPLMDADHAAIAALQSYMENQARAKGYKRIMAFPLNLTLAKHYEKLGYNRVGAIELMAKEI